MPAMHGTPTRSGLDRTGWPVFALLVATFLLFEFTSLDLQVQDLFYDFTSKTWWIDPKSPVPRAFFITAPKSP
jgi:hypothetical protein